MLNPAIKRLVYFLCLISLTNVRAQHSEYPFIRHFNSKSYNASFSNIALAQDQNGLLYVGNLEGLLIYDGNKWIFNDVFSGKAVYGIIIDATNKVYIHSQDDFGYLSAKASGETVYHSIRAMMPSRNLGRIITILPTTHGLYILTHNYLIKWHNNEFEFYQSGPLGFQTGFVFKDQLIVKERNQKVKIFKEDRFEFFESDEFLDSQSLAAPAKLNTSASALFLSWPNTNVFSISNQGIIKNELLGIEPVLSSAIPFSAAISPMSDKIVFIGTRNQGVFKVDTENHSFVNYNDEINFINNATTKITFDNQNGLWVAHTAGVSRIQPETSWMHWDAGYGLKGPIYSLSKNSGQLLIGTSNGLMNMIDGKIREVPAFNKRVWSFKKMKDKILISSDIGIYQYDDGRMTELSSVFGPGHLLEDRMGNVLIPSERNGVFQGANLRELKNAHAIFPNLTGMTSSAAIDNNNHIWLSKKFDAIYQLLDQDTSKLLKKYTTAHGLPDVNQVKIVNYDGRLLFGTTKGIYTINAKPSLDSADFFIPHPHFIRHSYNVKLIEADALGNLWLCVIENTNHNRVIKLEKGEDGQFKSITLPFNRLPDQIINVLYPDPEAEGILWIGGTEGLFRYDENVPKQYDLPFNTLIRKVSISDSVIFHGYYFDPKDTATVPSLLLDQPNEFKPTLTYDQNSIRFEFAATSYEVPEKNMFSYSLKGSEKGWSPWSYDYKKEYNNLKAGTYTFMVKSKNVYDTEGRQAEYTFTVLPPWYATLWARFLFVLVSINVLWLILLLYSYRLRMHRKHLKMLVADRTFEVMQQKREIETQNAVLREQNEEISQQSDQIELKNQELQSQQEEILAINHQLEEMNKYLERKVEKRTSKIRATLEKLTQTNKELDTFIYRASHDLKGPISRINGLSSLAKLESPSPSSLKYLNMIEQTVREMDVLLAKLTKVHDIFNHLVIKETIDFPSLLKIARDNVSYLEQGNDIQYQFDLPVQQSFAGDKQLIQVILENLLENALIFSKRNGDKQQISITVRAAEAGIELVITDNGRGIDENHRDRIFDMFYRADDQSKGSGLGLYLVKIAVEKLLGAISIESKKGEFTTFTVQIPD